MKRKLSNTLVKASLPVALATPSLFAQSEELSDAVVVYGENSSSDQVSAFKTGTALIDVPQSLSVFTTERIEEQGISSIGQIIDYTPGVNTSQGEGHRDAVVFRGIRSTADFFVDGVRDDVQYYRSLYNLEQVEILRGPNALFFGRGGAGGVLNRVTKKAQLGEEFSNYSASIDSFGQTELQFDSNYTLSDKLAFRLNIHHDHLANHRDHYDGNRVGINPTFTYELSDNTILRFSYEHADHERFIDRGIPTGVDGRPVEAFDDIVFGDADLNITTLESHVFTFDAEHQISDNWSASFKASYGTYDKFYQNFYASGYDQVATPDRFTIDGYADSTDRQNLTFAGDLVGEFETGKIKHKMVVGAEFIKTSSDQDRYNANWDTTNDDNEVFLINNFNLRNGVAVNAAGVTATNNFNTDINDDTRVDIDAYSFFLHDEIEVNEKLDVVLGARFDSFNIDVFNVVANERRSRKDSEVSPRLGLVYKPVEHVSIYGSYSETFQPRSGEQYANINGDNNRLDPNTFTNLEVGVKWEIKDDLNLTLSAFEIEQSSPQFSDIDPTQFVTVDSEVTGFEAQLQGNITDRWSLSAGYTYLEGEQVDQNGDTGLTPRELPEHSFSLWNNYQVNEKFGVGLGFVYQDESFINNGNTAELPSYFRVDAAAYYQINDDFRLQLNVENLTDTTYFPNSHSTHQASVGAPINARFAIIGKF